MATKTKPPHKLSKPDEVWELVAITERIITHYEEKYGLDRSDPDRLATVGDICFDIHLLVELYQSLLGIAQAEYLAQLYDGNLVSAARWREYAEQIIDKPQAWTREFFGYLTSELYRGGFHRTVRTAAFCNPIKEG